MMIARWTLFTMQVLSPVNGLRRCPVPPVSKWVNFCARLRCVLEERFFVTFIFRVTNDLSSYLLLKGLWHAGTPEGPWQPTWRSWSRCSWCDGVSKSQACTKTWKNGRGKGCVAVRVSGVVPALLLKGKSLIILKNMLCRIQIHPLPCHQIRTVAYQWRKKRIAKPFLLLWKGISKSFLCDVNACQPFKKFNYRLLPSPVCSLMRVYYFKCMNEKNLAFFFAWCLPLKPSLHFWSVFSVLDHCFITDNKLWGENNALAAWSTSSCSWVAESEFLPVSTWSTTKNAGDPKKCLSALTKICLIEQQITTLKNVSDKTKSRIFHPSWLDFPFWVLEPISHPCLLSTCLECVGVTWI